MDKQVQNEEYPKAAAIPKLFWSDLTAQPFEKCINCGENVLENFKPYMIEKAVRGFDGHTVKATVHEYAICISCAADMQLKLSESSRNRINQFFIKNVDFEHRLNKLAHASQEEWLKECLIRKEKVSEEEECQLYALAQGKSIIYKEFPYMISGAALDDMVELISAETMEQLNDFKDELDDGPPELKELFDKAGPRMLV